MRANRGKMKVLRRKGSLKWREKVFKYKRTLIAAPNKRGQARQVKNMQICSITHTACKLMKALFQVALTYPHVAFC